ncbi:MAG: hypothetical protein LBS60_05645 [Deltaproteobacteria bacterium]|jgi:hypothetical protein|nr:hypothetical protein [Deltaproteobacteria bacterium]
MDENLKKFYETDEGFAQYVDRHDLVGSRPSVKRAYRKFAIEQYLIASEMALRSAEDKAEAIMNLSLTAFRTGSSESDDRGVAETLEKIGVPKDIIIKARAMVQAERKKKG